MRWTLPAAALVGLSLLAATAWATDLKDVPFDSLKFRDVDNATKYQRPSGLEVVLTGVALEGNNVVARGFIENRTTGALDLTLQLPGGFFLSVRPNAAVKPPPPSNAPSRPEVYPWPRVFAVPAKSRVAWSATQSLDGYTWTESPKIDVDWTVAVWSEANGRGVFGTASVQLPARTR